MHHYEDLINIFNACFSVDYRTKLVKGGEEPIYLPIDNKRFFNEIHFAHGFFSSALHECSHWLIAGEARRKLIDFGYWYAPDGRDAEQQALFQQVEVKPQALEWILSKACGYRFYVSLDNLNGNLADTKAFKEAVYQQVLTYCQEGLSDRAHCLRQALSSFYKQSLILESVHFSMEELG